MTCAIIKRQVPVRVNRSKYLFQSGYNIDHNSSQVTLDQNIYFHSGYNNRFLDKSFTHYSLKFLPRIIVV